MKALVLKDYMRLAIEEVPSPQPAPDQVVVAVQACGICGSDVHGLDGSTGRRIPPVVMGHEAAGVIVEVGAEVGGFRAGDRVTFDSTVYCGTCWYCRRGRINLCENRRVLGVSCRDYRIQGAFAEYVAVPERVLYRLPDSITFERAAMVEPCSIAFHAVNRTGVTLNDTAVVVGVGMIGLLVVQTLRAAGCGRIIAVDIEQGKLDLAERLGADVTVNSSLTDAPIEILEETGGRGADLAFEAVGVSSSLATALAGVRKGGAVALIGNVAPVVEFAQQVAVTRELDIYGCCASNGEYPACLDMIGRGVVEVDALISVVASLAEGPAWFKRLYDREAGLIKVVLRPGGQGEG